MAVQLVDIRVQQKSPDNEFPTMIGDAQVLAVPRAGEFLHVQDVDGEDTWGIVVAVDHFAEAKPPYASDANILITIEVTG